MSTRSNRPLSRASTTSVHSFEQFQQPQQPRPSQFPQQPQYHAPFTTSEALQPALLQAAQQVSAQDQLINMSLESVQQYLGSRPDREPPPIERPARPARPPRLPEFPLPTFTAFTATQLHGATDGYRRQEEEAVNLRRSYQ